MRNNYVLPQIPILVYVQSKKGKKGKNGALFEKAVGTGEQEPKKSAFYDTQQVSG
jgi:hypothetical protein